MSTPAFQPPTLDRFWMGAYGGRITQQVARAVATPPRVPQTGYLPPPQFTTATAALAWDAARQRESQLAALRWPSAQRFDPAFWTSGAAPDPLRWQDQLKPFGGTAQLGLPAPSRFGPGKLIRPDGGTYQQWLFAVLSIGLSIAAGPEATILEHIMSEVLVRSLEWSLENIEREYEAGHLPIFGKQFQDVIDWAKKRHEMPPWPTPPPGGTHSA
jgi:hypothetical protein